MSAELSVGLVMFIGMFSDNGLGDPMIKRPLVMSTLVGLFLGDIETGLIMGAALELIYLGITGIGGALPSDSMTGAIFGTSFAILTDSGVEVAMALAVPIGILSVFIRNLLFLVASSLMPMVDRFIDNGEDKKVIIFHLGTAVVYSLVYFIIGYIGILLGSDVVESLVNSIPTIIMDALTVVSQLLPALGLAILLNMLWDKKTGVFLLLGFVLSAYLNMPIIAIAIIGLVISVYVVYNEMDMKNNKSDTHFNENDTFIEEDFFNE